MRPDRAIRPKRPRLAWEPEFRARLERGDPVGAVDVLAARGPKRKGSIPGVVGKHAEAAARILADTGGSALVRRDWALRLLVQPSSTHRTLAASLLPPLWKDYPRDVERALTTLAEDDDWVTREDAASALGTILDAHFVAFLPRVREWIGGRSSRLRRAAVLGAKLAARGREPDRAEPLLDLVEPALRDPDPYVRKNLGAFAIGDGLLRAYPDATLGRLERWAADDDENVRWNVAMAFTAAQGALHVGPALAMLAPLAADERRPVWRAVASALRNLARRRPKEVRPTLFAWRDDPKRKLVAETAIALAPSVRV